MTQNDMPTSAVLNRAADLIEERGWTAGSGWEDLLGMPLCAEGAIAAAMGQSMGIGFRCDAYYAVRDYIGDQPVWMWNDALIFNNGSCMDGWVGGSEEAALQFGSGQVIATLRAAAVIEQARESKAEVSA